MDLLAKTIITSPKIILNSEDLPRNLKGTFVFNTAYYCIIIYTINNDEIHGIIFAASKF